VPSLGPLHRARDRTQLPAAYTRPTVADRLRRRAPCAVHAANLTSLSCLSTYATVVSPSITHEAGRRGDARRCRGARTRTPRHRDPDRARDCELPAGTGCWKWKLRVLLWQSCGLVAWFSCASLLAHHNWVSQQIWRLAFFEVVGLLDEDRRVSDIKPECDVAAAVEWGPSC
jgi:hypothetical protein